MKSETGLVAVKCITVYTDNFEQFMTIYEKILQSLPPEDEEREIDGVMVYGAGHIPEQYVERMRQKREVVVMRVKDAGIIILQRGAQFEIIVPEQQNRVSEKPSIR